MSAAYNDGKIECTPNELRIHGYYFPSGTKNVPYSSIQRVLRVQISAVRGKWRIWGTGNPKYWLNLDPGRPKKEVGLVLDIGKPVKPVITPDDPDAVEAILRERAGLGLDEGPPMSGPFL